MPISYVRIDGKRVRDNALRPIRRRLDEAYIESEHVDFTTNAPEFNVTRVGKTVQVSLQYGTGFSDLDVAEEFINSVMKERGYRKLKRDTAPSSRQ